MPTYDYQCRRCGHTIEVIHGMTEEGPSACERCGGELRRILHPAGIIFRGSGFYKTDSRSSSSASVPAGSKSSPGKGESSTPAAKAPEGGGSSGGSSSTTPGGSSAAAD